MSERDLNEGRLYNDLLERMDRHHSEMVSTISNYEQSVSKLSDVEKRLQKLEGELELEKKSKLWRYFFPVVRFLLIVLVVVIVIIILVHFDVCKLNFALPQEFGFEACRTSK